MDDIRVNSSVKIKNIVFSVYYVVIILLLTFPGPFDWSNRIKPWVVGLPFSFAYLFGGVLLLCIGLVVQYVIESKLGELDLDVDISMEE